MKNCLEKVCAVLGILAIGIIGYGKYWESKQEKIQINARVLSAVSREYYSDLFSSSWLK